MGHAGDYTIGQKGFHVVPDPVSLLRRVLLFADLNQDALAGLAAHLRRRTFSKNTIIFHQDQAGDALYVVESGRVRIFRSAENGQEITVDTLGPGDFFGEMALLDGLPRSASAFAEEDCVTYTLARPDFQGQLSRSPEMAGALLELLSARLRKLMHYAETLVFFDVHARVRHVLLDLAHRYGVKEDGSVLINVDITQGELATMVGATRERVNRALASLRAQGVIDVRGKRMVIRDPTRLSEGIS